MSFVPEATRIQNTQPHKRSSGRIPEPALLIFPTLLRPHSFAPSTKKVIVK